MFNYGQMEVVDQMRTSWKKLVHHIGSKYGPDIINELHIKTVVNITAPVHLPQVLVRHATWELLVRIVQTNTQMSHKAQPITIKASATSNPLDENLTTKIAILDNEIAKGDYKLDNKIPIEMSNSEKTAYGNDWCTK